MKVKHNVDYLTEEKLGLFLTKLYPNNNFIHNKKVPNSNILNRPDFRCDELMIIVEFDGYQHFTIAKNITIDRMKDEVYSKMGYKIIRIPYFIQLSTTNIKYFFNLDYEYNQTYLNGFIDSKAILPADFCELGEILFEDILVYLPTDTLYEIMYSLTNKYEFIMNKLKVNNHLYIFDCIYNKRLASFLYIINEDFLSYVSKYLIDKEELLVHINLEFGYSLFVTISIEDSENVEDVIDELYDIEIDDINTYEIFNPIEDKEIDKFTLFGLYSFGDIINITDDDIKYLFDK